MTGIAPRSAAHAIKTISSRQHPLVRRYRTLARNGSDDAPRRRVLLDGFHLLTEAEASGVTFESAVFDQALLTRPGIESLARRLVASGADVFAVKRDLLEAISPVRAPSGGVAIVIHSPVAIEAAWRGVAPLAIMGHNVQDPGNVGAIIRAAEAAGASAFVCSGSTADPFGWKAARGSMGSVLRLPIVCTTLEIALEACCSSNVRVLAMTPRGGRSMYDVDLRGRCLLLFGGEGKGLPAEVTARADERLSIPMQSPVESLNVAVAAALVLYEGFRQREVGGTP